MPYPLEAVRRVLDTNFFVTPAVTQAVRPLLRAAPAARIVNVSSSLGSLTLNGDPTSIYYSAQIIGYNASKTPCGQTRATAEHRAEWSAAGRRQMLTFE